MSSNFTWIPFYTEFADKLREFKDDRSGLVEIIKAVFNDIGMKLPKLEKDGDVFDIDPFTVFGLFNKGITDENRKSIAEGFKNALGISAEVPYDFNGIPVVNNLSATFYYFANEREEHDIDNLWKVFVSALDYADNKSEENHTDFCKWYDTVKTQKGVNWNLTMGLFWIRPYSYLNLDSVNRGYLHDSDEFSDAFREFFRKNIKRTLPSSDLYLTLCKRAKDEIGTNDGDYTDLPSFSRYVWLNSQQKQGEENEDYTDWYPPAHIYDPELTSDDWSKLLNDPKVFDTESLEVITRFYDYGGEATCKELSVKYGKHWGYYNIISTKLAKRVHEKTNCPVRTDRDGKNRWWSILYIGKNAQKEQDGEFIWKIRPELMEALSDHFSDKNFRKTDNEKYTKSSFLSDVFLTPKEYDKLSALLLRKKNIILQGAPGVGKTYCAKRLAYSIIGSKNDSCIRMVQFHQSYSYEDFVYGYRPNDNGAFEPTPGVFYKFCEEAKNDRDNKYFFIIDEINRGNLSKIFGELLMLIESDKRGQDHEIDLLYGGEPFYVPDNLHIIGLMNTADRSLALIDYALRRRFSFYTMKPAFENAADNGFGKYTSDINCPLYHEVIKVIMSLNKAIREDTSLGEGFEIGHSYFAPQDTSVIDDEWVKSVVEYEILPLINEYWFDDDKSAARWNDELCRVTGESNDN